ncbi:hypothetical protein, partial [Escherichia coli]|uniref:hypothetical protein n=1 Tax=Escherichia coli TaxID=562 RepID=UPI0019546BCD
MTMIDLIAGRHEAAPPPRLPIVHRRRWGSWILGAAALALVATIIVAAARSRILDVAVVGQYIFSPLI